MPSDNNKILPYASNAQEGINLQTQTDYTLSNETIDGVKTGVANGSNFNKLAKQTSLIASSVAQFIAERLKDKEINDTLSVEELSSYINDSITDVISFNLQDEQIISNKINSAIKTNKQTGITIIDITNTAITSFNQLTEPGIYWCYKKLEDGPEPLYQDFIFFQVLVTKYALKLPGDESATNLIIKIANTALPSWLLGASYRIQSIYFSQIISDDNIDPWTTESNSLDITNAITDADKVFNDDKKILVSSKEGDNPNTISAVDWSIVFDKIGGYRYAFYGYNKPIDKNPIDLNNIKEGVFIYDTQNISTPSEIINAPDGFDTNTTFTVHTNCVYDSYVSRFYDIRKQIIFKGKILGSETYVRQETRQNVWTEWKRYDFEITQETTAPSSDSSVLMIDTNKNLVRRSVSDLQGVFGGNSSSSKDEWKVLNSFSELSLQSTPLISYKYKIYDSVVGSKTYKKLLVCGICKVDIPADTDIGGITIGVPENLKVCESGYPLNGTALTSINYELNGQRNTNISGLGFNVSPCYSATNGSTDRIHLSYSLCYRPPAYENKIIYSAIITFKLDIFVDNDGDIIPKKTKAPTPTAISVSAMTGNSVTINYTRGS